MNGEGRGAAARGAAIVVEAGKSLALPAFVFILLTALEIASAGIALLSFLFVALGETVLAVRHVIPGKGPPALKRGAAAGDWLHRSDRGFWRCWLILGLLPLWIALGFGTTGLGIFLGAVLALGAVRSLAGWSSRFLAYFRRA
jgi:hypothetical protein